ncbi:MAG: M23 family metallopeptidase [Elusimicrobiota bacterium]
MNDSRLKRFLINLKEKRFTIMFIPHSNKRPFKLSIPLLVIYSSSLALFLVIVTTSFIITRHIDYISAVANNIILQNKIEHFSEELIKNKNFLDELKEVDQEMRLLLGLKSKKSILEAEGVGGPLPADEAIMQRYLSGDLKFSMQEFNTMINQINSEIKSRLDSSNEIFNYLDEQRGIESSRPSIWPTTGRITSRFGSRVHPLTGRIEFHKGIDIANKSGTPILATSDGKVLYAGRWGSYGRVIIIDHGNGYSSRYAHLLSFEISRGDQVKKGRLIALMGTSGISTGTHLHYEVRFKNTARNPLYYVGRYKRK